VDDQTLVGLPENPPDLPVEIVLQVNGQELRYIVDTKYRMSTLWRASCGDRWLLSPTRFLRSREQRVVSRQTKTESVQYISRRATGL